MWTILGLWVVHNFYSRVSIDDRHALLTLQLSEFCDRAYLAAFAINNSYKAITLLFVYRVLRKPSIDRSTDCLTWLLYVPVGEFNINTTNLTKRSQSFHQSLNWGWLAWKAHLTMKLRSRTTTILFCLIHNFQYSNWRFLRSISRSNSLDATCVCALLAKVTFSICCAIKNSLPFSLSDGACTNLPKFSFHWLIDMGYWPSVRSRWVDIGQVLFLGVYGLRWVESRSMNSQKKNEANIQPSWPNNLGQ